MSPYKAQSLVLIDPASLCRDSSHAIMVLSRVTIIPSGVAEWPAMVDHVP